MQVGEEDCCPPGSRRRSGLPAGAIVQVFVHVFVQVIVQVIVQVFESHQCTERQWSNGRHVLAGTVTSVRAPAGSRTGRTLRAAGPSARRACRLPWSTKPPERQ